MEGKKGPEIIQKLSDMRKIIVEERKRLQPKPIPKKEKDP